MSESLTRLDPAKVLRALADLWESDEFVTLGLLWDFDQATDIRGPVPMAQLDLSFNLSQEDLDAIREKARA